MTKEKLKELFQFYRNQIASDEGAKGEIVTEPCQLDDSEMVLPCSFIPEHLDYAHLKFMCVEGQKFVDEDRIEKAMRWLGFLQGVLWNRDFFTLEELKNHSRPDSIVGETRS